MTTFMFEPLDTLFFRDGRPYDQREEGANEADSFFPPHPPTLVGAIRAGLYQLMGGQAWPTAQLGWGTDWTSGDGPLGPLVFAGPWLMRQEEPLVPLPACFVDCGRAGLGAVAPESGNVAVTTDAGDIRLPQLVRTRASHGRDVADATAQRWKSFEAGSYWCRKDALEQALRGELPDQAALFAAEDLWCKEQRIGISRDPIQRTTQFGALYASTHTRLRSNTGLAMDLVSQPPELPADDLVVPLGGENRAARVWNWDRPVHKDLPQPDLPEPDADGVTRYTVTLLTPAYFPNGIPGAGHQLSASDGNCLPGCVVSACLHTPIRVGGWSSVGTRPGPLPLSPVLPAGSTWFLETEATEPSLACWHMQGVGESRRWGFGRIALGRWPGHQAQAGAN